MVAGDEFADAGLWLRMKIRFHLMMCRHCSRYAGQIREMGTSVKERFGCADEPAACDDLQQKILGTAGKSQPEQDSS